MCLAVIPAIANDSVDVAAQVDPSIVTEFEMKKELNSRVARQESDCAHKTATTLRTTTVSCHNSCERADYFQSRTAMRRITMLQVHSTSVVLNDARSGCSIAHVPSISTLSKYVLVPSASGDNRRLEIGQKVQS
jgi:hypothetical protein